MKYMIIEVVERSICDPEYFNTLDDAKQALKEMSESVKDSIITCEGMVVYGEMANHDNWDAEIFEVET